MIRLPKIGNLKLGLVRNGKPIATSRILVTKATKEGLENFKILVLKELLMHIISCIINC